MDAFTTLDFLDGTMPVFADADCASLPTFESRTPVLEPLLLSGDCPMPLASSSSGPSPHAKALCDPHLVVNADSPCGFGGGYCVVA
ncbi:lipopeptide mating pheromone precursor bbp2-8 [Schizophyllum fasciatum]